MQGYARDIYLYMLRCLNLISIELWLMTIKTLRNLIVNWILNSYFSGGNTLFLNLSVTIYKCSI